MPPKKNEGGKKKKSPDLAEGLSKEEMKSPDLAEGLSKEEIESPDQAEGLSKEEIESPDLAEGLPKEEMKSPDLAEGLSKKKMSKEMVPFTKNVQDLLRGTQWRLPVVDRDKIRIEDRKMEAAEEQHQVEIKPPKQNEEGKKEESPEGKKSPDLAEGLPKEIMSKEQQERDKMSNEDREMEEAEERHLVEIKQEHHSQEGILCKDMSGMRVDIEEQELANEMVLKNLKTKQADEITRLRNDFERQVKEIENKYEEEMHILRDEMDLRREIEIREAEVKKDEEFSTLMENHEKDFSEMSNDYNCIILNYQASIDSLKEKMEDMRRKKDRLETEMANLQLQNRALNASLEKAREEAAELRKQVCHLQECLTPEGGALKPPS